MSDKVTIEVDRQAADALRSRAAELGVTVSELVTELVALDTEPAAIDAEQIAELDRRWAAIDAGGSTVPHEAVSRWLRTWGTRQFRPWQRP